MVLVRFSKFIEKVRSGEKKQTIRPAEFYKHLEEGDKIHCYSTKKVQGVSRPVTDELLYEGRIISIEIRSWADIATDTIAIMDGFENLEKMQGWFRRKYLDLAPDKKFRIIHWK